MPTYEYECRTCGYTFERVQNMSDDPVRDCPECGQPVRRNIFGGSGVIFKGSGFYVNDSKGKNPAAPAAKSNSGDSSGATGASGASGATSAPADQKKTSAAPAAPAAAPSSGAPAQAGSSASRERS